MRQYRVAVAVAALASGFAIVTGAGVARTSAEPLLYASNFYDSTIDVYRAGDRDAAPFATITAGVSSPYNLAVDRFGTLYVQNNNNTITEYARGGTSPVKTLTEPAAGPGGYGTGVCVAVAGDGTVYAADRYGSQVYAFAHGSTVPTAVLPVAAPYGLAVDPKGNLYVGYSLSNDPYASHVEVFAAGKAPGRDLGITLKYGGGIALDPAGNLLAGDQGTRTIEIYRIGAKKPFRHIVTAPNFPYQFQFGPSGRRLFVVGGEPVGIDAYDYATGTFLWKNARGFRSGGYTMGLALDPASR